jgi:carboxypeptidase C (cathepsin A)
MSNELCGFPKTVEDQMKYISAAGALLLSLGFFASVPASAADTPANVPSSDPQSPLSRLPPEAGVNQSIAFQGRTLKYRASAGAIPVYDEAGSLIADVAYTSFILDGQPTSRRPVTFIFGGGPGAAAGSLIFGLGPRRVREGTQGDAASTPIDTTDNASTWLEFTDLVFVDPVGTGFSRSFASREAAAREFYGIEQDAHYLSGVIYDWLKAKERLHSPIYVTGESYGGFRAPRVTLALEESRGVGVTGLILISPLLDFDVKTATGVSRETLSPMQFAVDLPSMAAANYERQGKTLSPELMHEVEEYSRGEYVTALLKGVSDPDGFDQMIKRVATYTGIDETLVRQAGGRLEQEFFLRELFRSSGGFASRYDINWVAKDPYPWAASSYEDMVFSILTIEAEVTSDFVTRVLGWKAQGTYRSHNQDIYPQWTGPSFSAWTSGKSNMESLSPLRHLLARDSNFKLLIAHGYTDLACSYMMSRLAVDQIPNDIRDHRVLLRMYPGGHMFYEREASGRAFMEDAATIYPK